MFSSPVPTIYLKTVSTGETTWKSVPDGSVCAASCSLYATSAMLGIGDKIKEDPLLVHGLIVAFIKKSWDF